MTQVLGEILSAFRPGRMPPALAWVVSLIGVSVLLILLVNSLSQPAAPAAPAGGQGGVEAPEPDPAEGSDAPSPGIIDSLPSAGDPREGVFSPSTDGGSVSTTARETCNSTACNIMFNGLLFGSAAGIVVVAWLKRRRLKVWVPLSVVALVLGIGQPFFTPVHVLAAVALAARPDLNKLDPAEAQLVAEEEEAARREYEVDSTRRAETARQGQLRVMTWLSRVAAEIDAAAARHEWSSVHTQLPPLAEIYDELNRMYIPLTDASKASWRRALEAIGAYEKAVRRGVSLSVYIAYHPPPQHDGFFAARARGKIAKRNAKVAQEVRKAGDILEDSTLYIGYSRAELLGPDGPAPEAAAPPEVRAEPEETHAEPAATEPVHAAGLPTESLREQAVTAPPQRRAGWQRPARGHRRRRF